MRINLRKATRVMLGVMALTWLLPCAHSQEAMATSGSSAKAAAPLVSPVPMPEPSTLALLAVDFLALGACVLLLHRRRQRGRQ